MRSTFFLALSLFFSISASAAIFDSADFLPMNGTTLGAFGEFILNDPAGEGIEARARHGWTDDFNIGAMIGTGSKNRKFRFGGEAAYNIIPDYENQLGITGLADVIFLRRHDSSGLQFRFAPLLHKKVNGWNGLPATLFLSLPFQLEFRRGAINSGSQFVFGGIFDANKKSEFYLSSELGLKIAHAETYVLFGAGFRFGEVSFAKASKSRANETKDREYRSEDFQ